MKKFIFYILTGIVISAAVMVPFSGGISSLPAFFAGAEMLLVVSLWALGFAVTSFLFGIISGDYSWIDRMWSVLPVCFAVYYAVRSGGAPAPCIAALLVTIWGVRLTFNFARKGGYNGGEDYRWVYLRKKITNPILWQLFNLVFISFFQTGLFVLFTYPVYALTLYSAQSIPVLFWIFSALGFLFICFESISDQQQWNFHAAKKLAFEQKDYPSKYSADVKNGFLSQGLFSICRHPNYFGELGFWWTIWFTAFSFKWDPLGSGIFGTVVLSFIFLGSTILTEKITSSKYLEYKSYKKKTVSAVIPLFKRR